MHRSKGPRGFQVSDPQSLDSQRLEATGLREWALGGLRSGGGVDVVRRW
jgi:hypothetical protein